MGVGAHEVPAGGQPQARGAVAAVGGEGADLADGDQPIGERVRRQPRAVRRPLVVEREAFAAVAELDQPAGERGEGQRRRAGGRGARRRARAVAGRERLLRQRVQRVGEDQLLVLLLVGQPQRQRRCQRRDLGVVEPRQQRHHLAVDRAAVGRDLVAARPRQQPALRPRVPRPDRLVVRVPQEPGARIDRRDAARLQHERLEEPRRVRAVPLGRAARRHRLQLLIFWRQRRRQRLGARAHGAEALGPPRAAHGSTSTPRQKPIQPARCAAAGRGAA
jgi:hypothetical protein